MSPRLLPFETFSPLAFVKHTANNGNRIMHMGGFTTMCEARVEIKLLVLVVVGLLKLTGVCTQ